MSDKPKKPQKLKARLPRGLADRGPSEIAATREMVETIRQVYELYGFEPVETPMIEYTDALGKFLPDQDRPNEGVFSFQDDTGTSAIADVQKDEQWLSLRYDLTAPLARYVAENFDALPKPYRSYRFGWVFRNEKPGPGRFRQFMQFDADTVGSASMAADAEVCMMIADTMERLGIPRGSYVVKVNNRKVLDGVMESVEIDDIKRLTVMRAIDKFDRLGFEGTRLLLGRGRKDESGDFTKGAELTETQIENVMVLFEVPSFAEEALAAQRVPSAIHGAGIEDIRVFENRRADGIFGGVNSRAQRSAIGLEGLSELRSIWKIVSTSGYNDGRIRIDPSVVRGLEYYTGPVYEVELLIETKDEKGRPVRFGSVGGGGRYDGLVSRFRGEPVPATGFSIGVSRLQAALTLIGKLGTKAETGPVVVTVFDKDRLADYQKMVSQLRAANIRAELYLGNPKNNLGVQFKYADRRNSPCAIIQGSDEKEKGEVQIKDLIEGAKAAAAIASNQEWRETRPAQFSCKESELVEKVREVLARHGLLHPSP
jgi:histidyl-tRNA synthetase